MYRTHFRDCDAWRKENLPMNTTSNEAAKLYDVALSQLSGYYEDPQYNGLEGTLSSMINADPEFILGNCIKLGAELLGNNVALGQNKETSEKIVNLIKIKDKHASDLSKRELYHVKAIESLARGDLPDACYFWEDILIDHPTDLLAIKYAHSAYFYLGYKRQTAHSVARVLPYWNHNIPLHNYLYGMYAFGLTQNNLYDLAEITARKGLALNKHDAWAAHAVSHANEYRSRFNEGIKFLQSTEEDWNKCTHIACHNYWHLSLFYLENNQHEEAFQIYDKELMKSGSLLDLVNASSLLTRLKVDGCTKIDDMNSRWLKLKDSFIKFSPTHGFMLSDSHLALVLAVCGTDEEKQAYLKSLNDFINSDDITIEDKTDMKLFNGRTKQNIKSFLKTLNEELATDLFTALFHFGKNEYSKVVELLYPLRYDLVRIGGSFAQIDVFNQVLTYAALNSFSEVDKRIGLALLNERFSMRPNSLLNKRLAAKFCSDEELSNIVEVYK